MKITTPDTASPAPSATAAPVEVNGNSAILLVDDAATNIKIVRKYLSMAGYGNVSSTTSPHEVVPMMIRSEPDLVLLDIMMPGVSGLDLLATIREDAHLRHIPVVMLTAVEDRETKCQALSLGATDFLAKPVDPSELISRVRSALLVKTYHDSLRDQAANLARLVSERTAQLEASQRDLIHCLARAAEFRDDDTGRHVVRVGCYAGVIARHLGWSDDAAAELQQAAQLHDVGKIGVPDSILHKPGKLTDEEFAVIQKHCGFGKRVFDSLSDSEWRTWRRHAELGQRILAGCDSSILDMAAQIALTHHERWDGTGYPIGLAGEDIPLVGRITAVADVFDALSTKRSYKPAFSLEKCFAILTEGRGTHFDPAVVDAFFRGREEIIRVQLMHAESH